MAKEPISRLIRSLESKSGEISTSTRDAICALPIHEREVQAGALIVRIGSKPSSSILVLDGMLIRHKIVGDGKRQIISIHIAGDMPDLQSLFLKTMDHDISAVQPSRIGLIPHEALRVLIRDCPEAGKLLWGRSLVDASLAREWLVNVGRRRAVSRAAHLLCEYVMRSRAVGLSDGRTCEWPLTQGHMSDALGLSAVHINRSLQELRKRNLIVLEKNTLEILDFEGLKELGDFDETYLHLQDVPVEP